MRPVLKTLNNKQLTQLEEALRPYTISLEKLDGFFAALYISTELLMPNDYFPYIFGDEGPEFDSIEQAQTTLILIMGLWNDVSNRFQKELFFPLLNEDGLQSRGINDWAQGFLDGIKFSAGFKEFLDDESKEGHMVPLLTFAYEHHEDPELRPFQEPISTEHRGKIFQHLVASVNVMYRYNLQFRAPATEPKNVKVGRNEPCRCGSGKKYKKCCLHLFQ